MSFKKAEPEAILDRKMVKRGRVATTKVLIKWKGLPVEHATWEFYYDLLKKFPSFFRTRMYLGGGVLLHHLGSLTCAKE